MSVRIMSAVWDRGTRFKEGRLLVLLAMADWANDNGVCWPSVPELARKARLTERQAYAVLKYLQDDGVLERTGDIAIRNGDGWRFLKNGAAGGRGRLTVYRINTEILSGNARVNPEENSVKPEPENPEVCDAETLKSATENPEVGDIPPHPPLGRTVSKPSERTVSKNHSPYPLAGEGAKQPHVDGMSWGRFRLALKEQLEDAPLQHANFREVERGEWDYNACFRDWWLVGLEPPGERATGPPRLLTEAENPAATSEGLRKYRKRVDELSRRHFGLVMEIVVQGRKESVQ